MNFLKLYLPAFIAAYCLCFLSSCANIGNPSGGPYDETPPRLIGSKPHPNETKFEGKKIEIYFDENVQLEKPSENVIITPPQKNTPVLSAINKKITVELKDSLIENMTYTIDFTNSIVDNNENNILENFSFAFSTGDVIDSLQVSGILLNAENLEPMPGILVGLHQNLEDSAFTTLPFFRTSKTNDLGRFTIRNIAPGSYRVYALKDMNRDYLFDQPGEAIAFYDSIVIPSSYMDVRQDTIWKDSLTIDTIRTVEFTHFKPDDVLMRLFQQKAERQYMQRPERNLPYLFSLKFNAPIKHLPEIELINDPKKENWFVHQDETNVINYWITDSTIWKQDTISIQVTYTKTDSLFQDVTQIDTVKLSIRNKPTEKPKKKRKGTPTIEFLSVQSKSGKIDLFDTISVVFNEPLSALSVSDIKLERMQDSLWVPAEFKLEIDSINPLKYYLFRDLKYAESYQLSIDSAAITSVYGKWNNTFKSDFNIKSSDEYGHLFIEIPDITEPAFVELLNSSDQPVRKVEVKDGGALFLNLKPDTYYSRLVVDRNNNGIWDTGNYAEKRQPEDVYYNPKWYKVLVNFKHEEVWNVLSTPLEKQKPLEITKNKPKEKKVKKNQNEKENGKQSNRSSGNRTSTRF